MRLSRLTAYRIKEILEIVRRLIKIGQPRNDFRAM